MSATEVPGFSGRRHHAQDGVMRWLAVAIANGQWDAAKVRGSPSDRRPAIVEERSPGAS